MILEELTKNEFPSLLEAVIFVLTSVAVSVIVSLRERKLKKMTDTVNTQLNNNGGSSLIDKLDLIVKKIDDLATSVSKLEVWKTAWMQLYEHPIFITNTKGFCTWVNNEYQKITGCTFAELEGANWSKIIHPEDRDQVTKEWQTCVDTGTLFDKKYRIINQQTLTVHNVRCKCKPLTRGLEVVGFIGIWEVQT